MITSSIYLYISLLTIIIVTSVCTIFTYKFFSTEKKTEKTIFKFNIIGFILLLFIPVLSFIKSYTEYAVFGAFITENVYRLFLAFTIVFPIIMVVDLKMDKKLDDKIFKPLLYVLAAAIGLTLVLPVVTLWVKLVPYLALGFVALFYSFNKKGYQLYGFVTLAVSLLFTFIPSSGFSLTQLMFLILLSLLILDYITIYTSKFSLINVLLIYDLLRSKILFKFLLIFTILITVSLLLTSLTILTITKRAIVDSQQKTFLNMGYTLKNEINKYTERNTALLNNLQKSTQFNLENAFILGAYLYDSLRNNPDIDKCLVISSQNILLADVSQEFIDTRQDVVTLPLYLEAINKNKMIKPYIALIKDKLFISVPVLSENDEYMYSFAAFFNLKHLVAIFDQIQKATSLDLDMVDEFYYSILQNREITKNDPLRNISIENNSFRRVIYNNEPVIVGMVTDPKLQVTYVIKQAERVALSGINQGERTVLVVLTVSVCVFLGLGFLISFILEKPIKSIYTGLQIYRKGNLDHQIQTNNIDEFGQLAKSLNEMAADLKNLMNMQAKSEQLATISQMAVSLNHEINNPLAAMVMAMGLLETRLKLQKDKELVSVLTLINEQINRIKELINNINNITEPVIEEYVSGTKMLKINYKK